MDGRARTDSGAWETTTPTHRRPFEFDDAHPTHLSSARAASHRDLTSDLIVQQLRPSLPTVLSHVGLADTMAREDQNRLGVTFRESWRPANRFLGTT